LPIRDLSPLSLPDALPISGGAELGCIRYDRSLAPRIEKRRILAHSIRQARGKISNPRRSAARSDREFESRWTMEQLRRVQPSRADRKSTRLNSSHGSISYA